MLRPTPPVLLQCSQCQGSREVDNDTCPKCNGKGSYYVNTFTGQPLHFRAPVISNNGDDSLFGKLMAGGVCLLVALVFVAVIFIK